MKVAGQELQFKQDIKLRNEKRVSVLLRDIGSKLADWFGNDAATEADLEAINAVWQEAASLMFEGDKFPHIDDVGKIVLLEVTEGFFKRGSTAKK